MKRYVVEMANDFEKKCPKKAECIDKIRNLYLCSLITVREAVKGIIEVAESEAEEC